MKFIVLFALFVLACGDENVQVVQDERVNPIGAAYSYLVALDNGVQFQQTGEEDVDGQIVVRGSYTHLNEETGEPMVVSFVADRNGYRPVGDHIPVAPAHVEELLRIAQDQRQQGIEFDEAGFQI